MRSVYLREAAQFDEILDTTRVRGTLEGPDVGRAGDLWAVTVIHRLWNSCFRCQEIARALDLPAELVRDVVGVTG